MQVYTAVLRIMSEFNITQKPLHFIFWNKLSETHAEFLKVYELAQKIFREESRYYIAKNIKIFYSIYCVVE